MSQAFFILFSGCFGF